MTIRIEIIDPTIKDEKMLVATARFLMELAGHQMVPAPMEESLAKRFTNEIVNAAVKIDTDIAMEVVNEMQQQTPVEYLQGWAKDHNERVEAVNGIDKVMEEVIEKTKKKRKPKKEEQEETILPMRSEVIPPPFAHCGTPEPVAPPPPVETKIDFNSLIAKITKLTDEKKLENADVLRIVRTHGLDKTHYLSTNPHLIEAVNADIDKFVEGK